MNNKRGSEWTKWDLHIHSPASFNWNNKERLHRLDINAKDTLLDQMVAAINNADIAVFAIMDYWTFDGILALRDFTRRKPNILTKNVLPGIELRIQAPKTDRLDIHAIFSEEIPDQRLRDFLATLKIQLMNGNILSLSRDSLIEYARALHDDQLLKHSVKRDQLADDDYAWSIGCSTCEVTLESFRQAMHDAPEGMAVVYQPWDTYHGLSDAKWQQHYTSAYHLFSQPDIFECKGADYRSAFLGIENSENSKFFNGFWKALGERPRLAVRGSDAHKFGDYGKFQSNLTTWIKADPTFRGLLQAIKEPIERSWLGDEPPKLQKHRNKPTIFIDQISLRKTTDHNLAKEDWFDGQSMLLNPDLVAIIGSKGSGKSALADILGLLGDTGNAASFTFLHPTRFRDKKPNRSLYFEAELIWANGEKHTRRLNEDPQPGTIERIRYIPQAYFEKVCCGESEEGITEFAQQIERVIFAYIPPDLRGDATDLQNLLRRQENEANRNLDRLRGEVRNLNNSICDIRRRSSSSVRSELEAQLKLRRQQLEDLQNAKPSLPAQLTPNNAQKDPNLVKLQELEQQKDGLDAQMKEARQRMTDLQQKVHTVTRLLNGLRNIETSVNESINRIQPEALALDIDITKIAMLNINFELVTRVQQDMVSMLEAQTQLIQGTDGSSLISKYQAINEQIRTAKSSLDAKQLEQQSERERYAKWESEVVALTGSKDMQSSIAHIEAQIDWVNDAPTLIKKNEDHRLSRTKEIAKQLLDIKTDREELIEKAKNAFESLIPKHKDFSLGFVNELILANIESRFFEFIKQVSGTFRGEEEGRHAFRDLVDAIALTSVDEITSVAQRLERATVEDHRDGKKDNLNLDDLLRKSKSPEEFLNLLYCLDYLQPQFTLALAGQPLTQLSPGQRGALLLVFYLLIEESDLPIVLDQPEENLDNETVYSLLVRVIKEAKKKRQIIMVTHNANLAVCCDAEQIIHASLDKTNCNKVTYISGPIEDPEINKLVINVLEGTLPAFNNRKDKYQLRVEKSII